MKAKKITSFCSVLLQLWSIYSHLSTSHFPPNTQYRGCYLVVTSPQVIGNSKATLSLSESK